MVQLRLEDLELYHLLLSKQPEPNAALLRGLLVSLSGDASELLGFVRNRFPGYTSHDLQHSWRIVRRIEAILTTDAKADLSAIEIFSFILAAALHDIGMVSPSDAPDEVRQRHHILSDQFIQAYLAERLSIISEYLPRLSRSVGFVVRAHGLTWDEMVASELFRNTERVMEQPLRVNLLCVLLRVGDLLDLDSDRSCDALLRHCGSYFLNNNAEMHHKRHKEVVHFNYDPQELTVIVDAATKESHAIWSEWFGYLRQDILHGNTYVFRERLSLFRLPSPFLQVRKAEGATYEIWPIRFELDEKGRIWDVISKSIYVGRLDFVRELIQNAIDAALKRLYAQKEATIDGEIPRLWMAPGVSGQVMIIYEAGSIEVIDNGTGMSRQDLQEFLFRVAETGFAVKPDGRAKPFPAIGKFGIGFVSCLSRASTIIIKTKKQRFLGDGNPDGLRVTLKTQALDAYSEVVDCPEGTSVWLQLKDQLSGFEIADYIRRTFAYPSVSIFFLDRERANELLQRGEESRISGVSLLNKRIEDVLHGSIEAITQLHQQIQLISAHINTAEASDEQPSRRKPLNGVSVLVAPAELPRMPEEPTIFLLNRRLGIARVVRSTTKKTGGGREKPIVAWIPVRLLVPDCGLEWASLHGLIVYDSVIKSALASYAEIGDEYHIQQTIVALGDPKEFGSDAFGEIDGTRVDVEELLTRESAFASEWEDREVERALTEVYHISVRENRVMLAARDEEPVDLFEAHTTQNRTYDDGKHNSLADNDEVHADFAQRVALLDNLMCQDGIPLPISAAAIAPIGACRARCNLTGAARFNLNASRNMIDEAPTFLKTWAETVGVRIQRAALSAVEGFCRKEGFSFDPDVLLRRPTARASALEKQCFRTLYRVIQRQ